MLAMANWNDLRLMHTYCNAARPDAALHAGLLGLKTLLCKLVGVCFSMAGGLIAGKEGPFVHSGDAPGHSSTSSQCCCWDTSLYQSNPRPVSFKAAQRKPYRTKLTSHLASWV